MKKITVVLMVLLQSICGFGQDGELIENKAVQFSIASEGDTIDFVVVDTLLDQKKPVFLWCQGSLPMPLFCEIENYGYYFFGGGIVNFDYAEICKNFHLVIISMPETPVMARKENLNPRYQYVPDANQPYEFSPAYVKADYLDNYVNRAEVVLRYLKEQSWVDYNKLVVAGHSQGSKVATKIAVGDNGVTHVGLFAANPFGRIDQYVRQARLDAQLGNISWEKADSLMNDYYDFYKEINNKDSVRANPSLLAWQSFSETYYDDWITLDIPIYLAYGTEDRTSDLCDLVPLFFIEKNKTNLTLKRYLGLEHNFFEMDENGRVDHQKGHWKEVMADFLKWVE